MAASLFHSHNGEPFPRAAAAAASQGLPVLVYLHSPYHGDSAAFARDVLGSARFAAFARGASPPRGGGRRA